MDDEQSVEELAAFFGSDGPVQVVRDWLSAVYGDGDLRVAWHHVDPDLRLVLAQAWVWANRTHPMLIGLDRDEVAQGLAVLDSSHALWPAFAAVQLEELRQLEVGEGWGFGSRPRPVAVDYELVYLIHTGRQKSVVISEPTIARVHPFLVHRREGRWLLAGFGPEPPQPGWPPVAKGGPSPEDVPE